MPIIVVILILIAMLAVAGALVVWQARKRAMQRWFVSYLRTCGRRGAPGENEEVHLLLCIADHFEPKGGKAPPEVASGRVENWVREYPRQFGCFRDSDGRPPRYTFFYPWEEYEAAYLDSLADLCRAGYGEVEIHLHHDNDTPAGFREKLLAFRAVLTERHNLLARQRITGAPAFGFIHGNWALCNCRPDGRFCGVNNEIDILRQTGCYADFTFPSAPNPSQPRRINSIYYASDIPGRPGFQEWDQPVGAGRPPDSALLLFQGPLLLDWKKRKWGLLPHLENGCLQHGQPPTMARLENWLGARIQVSRRPDWFFVKLHAHGAEEDSQKTLLGDPMVRFHEELARKARENPRFHYHYVTAREMYNLARAAEAGWAGQVVDALDYELVWNGSPAKRGCERNQAFAAALP